MSESNRDGAIALGLGVTFVAVVLIGLWGYRTENTPHPPSDPKTAQEQPANEASEQPGAVAPAVAPSDPATQNHNSQRAADSSNKPGDQLWWGDGLAQWGMAVTGLISLVVSGWAVWLVRETLTINKSALSIARLDRRAWVKIKGVRLDPGSPHVRVQGDRVLVMVQMEVENVGETPAREVAYNFSLVMLPGTWGTEAIRNEHERLVGARFQGELLFPGEFIPFEEVSYGVARDTREARSVVDEAIRKRAGFSAFVVAEVSYLVSGDEDRHFTARIFDLECPDLVLLADGDHPARLSVAMAAAAAPWAD